MIIVLHGTGNQYFLHKEYDELRNKGMLDKTKLSDEELVDAEITFPEGEGSTDPNKTYIFDNVPQSPVTSTIKVDRRTVGWYGLGK